MNTSLKLEGFKVAIGNQKTNIFGMAFINTVTRDNIIKSAVLSEIFLNSSKLFKNPVEINRRLNKMNGAVFNVGSCKKGDNLCLIVTLETLKNIAEEEAEGFIYDIVFKPYTDGISFDSGVFKRAVDTVKERITSSKDDKKYYALQRCLEEMFDFKGYGLSENGYIEDLEKLSTEDVYRYYEKLISGSVIERGITGRVCVDKSEVCEDVKYITETEETAQGRICMGFSAEGADEAALLLLNEIIGGNAGSKLFAKVREKENLCYYINSSLHRFKNVIIVQAGIEKAAKEKTIRLITQAVNDLENNITDEDILSAKASVKNIYLAKEDNPYGAVDNIIDSAIYGRPITINNKLEILEKTEKSDILKALEKLKLKTIYFLG